MSEEGSGSPVLPAPCGGRPHVLLRIDGVDNCDNDKRCVTLFHGGYYSSAAAGPAVVIAPTSTSLVFTSNTYFF